MKTLSTSCHFIHKHWAFTQHFYDSVSMQCIDLSLLHFGRCKSLFKVSQLDPDILKLLHEKLPIQLGFLCVLVGLGPCQGEIYMKMCTCIELQRRWKSALVLRELTLSAAITSSAKRRSLFLCSSDVAFTSAVKRCVRICVCVFVLAVAGCLKPLWWLLWCTPGNVCLCIGWAPPDVPIIPLDVYVRVWLWVHVNVLACACDVHVFR